MTKNEEYIAQYSSYAIEQQQRYGIPASIILAQGMLESANGQSQLARTENNHFGMKASNSWVASGGGYGLYTDDAKDERFCSYATVGESYEHHSKVLRGSSRYAACFALQPTDYKGWARGLQQAGYATDPKYAQSLISIIEKNGLTRFDTAAMQQESNVKSQVSSELGQRRDAACRVDNTHDVALSSPTVNYSFPLQREEMLVVTSPFGTRTDPTDSTKQQMHKGIDLRANHEPLLATEDGGRVVAVDTNSAGGGGKSIKIEYARADGTRVQVTCCHLERTDVKVGDTVRAGQQIGITGNTGTHTTGPHLHMGVKQLNSDGTTRDTDPAAYLADIAQRGGLTQQVMYNGQNLLAKYSSTTGQATDVADTTAAERQLSPEEWMRKLLCSEDSGTSLTTGDPVTELIMTMFTSLWALATNLDNKSEEAKMESATQAGLNRSINLTELVPQLKSCTLQVGTDGKAVLLANDGKQQVRHELTTAELSRLGACGASATRVAALVTGMVATECAAQRYEEQMGRGSNEQKESWQLK